jgi:hypothetical protein
MPYTWPENLDLTVKKNVGIGTDTPTHALEVKGILTVTCLPGVFSSIASFSSSNPEPPYVNWNHDPSGINPMRYGYIQAGNFGNTKEFRFVTENEANFTFLGGALGIGTSQPRNPLGIRSQGISEELISFETPDGVTKWHINQNLSGLNLGLNFVETAVADGRLFIQVGGNVGIGTTNPTTKLEVAETIKGTDFRLFRTYYVKLLVFIG